MKNKCIGEMNNHELLEFMIDFCRRYAEEFDTVTTGNLSHRIGNLKHGLVSCSDKVQKTMIKNDNEDKDCIPYEKQWCAFCEFFDGYDMCLRKGNFGAITNETIDKCSNDKLFRSKKKIN